MPITVPRASPWNLESTRPRRDLVTMCRSSGSTPCGRKTTWCVPVGQWSYAWPLPRLLDLVTLLCRTSGCSRSAIPLPSNLPHHTTWAQACDRVFSSFLF